MPNERADRTHALHERIRALEAENARLRAETDSVATANVSAALQLVEISETKTRELEAKNAEIARALIAAEQASEHKSRFLANISHELRTPISGIVGLAELLAASSLCAQQRDYVASLVSTAESFLDLINQLLDFAKIEAGCVTLERSDFDLWRVVEDVAQLLLVRAKEQGIGFSFGIDPAVPRVQHGDALRLRQVLLNLGTNAVKFTEVGRVQLRVEPSGGPSARRIRITVDDTGCGFDAAVGARLCEPFVQADASTTRRFGGTGLGLSISQRLIAEMAGTLSWHSEPGVGSSFWVELPVTAAARTRSTRPTERRGAVLHTVRPTTRETLELHLPRLGFTVVPPGTTESRVELLVLEASHDLRAALSALRAADPHTPLLLVANPNETIGDDLVREHNVLGLLNRPLRPTQLESVLREAPRNDDLDSRTHTEPFAGVRALVVEDTDINRRVLIAQLQKLGCTVESASDGRRAVELCATERFDVVFMDCQMPVLDGYDATRAIRADELERARPRQAIVALTANALLEDHLRSRQAGMDDHFVKPLRTAQLAAILQRFCASTPADLPR